MSVDLYDALNQTYLDKNGRSKHMGSYVYDNSLSNDEDMVYHDPINNKLLIGYRGTSNLDDLTTDKHLAIGQIRSTDRYKRSSDTHRRAKEKYNPKNTTLVGHSLGGSLSSAIGDDNDEIVSYNKGSGLLGNSTKTKNNERSYRMQNDYVSLLDSKGKTFRNPKKNTLSYFFKPWILKRVDDHSIEHIKNKNIYV